jgi:predicted esterase YcpF (UPF0227 family)
MAVFRERERVIYTKDARRASRAPPRGDRVFASGSSHNGARLPERHVYLYIHGFNSAPASIKARQLHSQLTALGRAAEFACPALPPSPREAMALLERVIADRGDQPLVLVGSSLGGFYATWLAERLDCRAVLVNPAITPHEGLEAWLGPQKNLYTGEAYELTRGHLAEMAALFVPRSTHPGRLFLMHTTGDELLDWRIAVARFAGSKQRIVEGSDHGFAEFEQYLDEVIAFGDHGA